VWRIRAVSRAVLLGQLLAVVAALVLFVLTTRTRCTCSCSCRWRILLPAPALMASTACASCSGPAATSARAGGVALTAVVAVIVLDAAWGRASRRSAVIAVFGALISAVAHLHFLAAFRLLARPSWRDGASTARRRAAGARLAGGRARPADARTRGIANMVYPGSDAPRGPLQRFVSEIFDKNEPPLFKNFLRVDLAPAGSRSPACTRLAARGAAGRHLRGADRDRPGRGRARARPEGTIPPVSTTAESARPRRLGAVLREGAQVTPLELFFDLVFVLALTQCTQLMADDPTGRASPRPCSCSACLVGLGRLRLADQRRRPGGGRRAARHPGGDRGLPRRLAVRPEAFDDDALLFALAYAAVRGLHILLFLVASRDQPSLRSSTLGLAAARRWRRACCSLPPSPTAGCRARCGSSRFLLDMAGRSSSAWRAGSSSRTTSPSATASSSSSRWASRSSRSAPAWRATSTSASWSPRSLGAASRRPSGGCTSTSSRSSRAAAGQRRPGREQNAVARDSFSYLHLPMVAGIVLVALGMKKTLGHVEDPLKTVPAVALLGGAAVYLLSHVAFRWRNVHRFSTQRLIAARDRRRADPGRARAAAR
jgi:hypothetical protein